MKPKYPKLVAANILLNKQNELLMGLRSKCLLWEIPGGKVENETAADAAGRELLEETGIVGLGDPTFCGFVEAMTDDEKRWFFVCYRWNNWRGFARRVEEDKCLQYRWFHVDGLPPLDKCTVGTRYFITHLLPTLVLEEEAKEVEDEEAEVYPFKDEA